MASTSIFSSQMIPPILSCLLFPTLLHAQPEKTGGNLSNCLGGCPSSEACVGNPFSQPVKDSECSACAGGKYWWPCNFETLCFCNDPGSGAPRVPPAPKSGADPNDAIYDVCNGILTEEVFNSIVQPTNEEGRALFTHWGLCNAISQYNGVHDEKFAGMGSELQIRAELAAFLAHAAVDTFGFTVTREELHCVDPIAGSDGQVYCKPCMEQYYDSLTKSCSQNYFVEEGAYKSYCDAGRQPGNKPGLGCSCDAENGVSQSNEPVPGSGYMPASSAFFTRGAIQINQNYDYFGASISMTGDPNFLCDNPDTVAQSPVYAWGAGIYKWMEKMTFGTQGSTAHQQVLKLNFGGTVEVLYGDLECPAGQWTSAIHVDMVQDRVAHVCRSGSALGVYLEMETCNSPGKCLKCDGLKEIYESCQELGTCPDCPAWTDFLISSAPTVTPIRREPPSWDDWSRNYGMRSSRAETKVLGRQTLVLASLMLFSAGSL